MKKHILIISFILFFSVTILIYSITQTNNISITAKPQNEVKTQYTLKDYNGRIALFVGDKDIPKEIFNTFTVSLPTEDADNIRKGITVYSEKELNELLENYLS
ncbi:MAG: BofC C-terminal domain-containing protein [Acutalibacteraceae bacterium]